MSWASVKLSTQTRDRLNELAAERGGTVEQAIRYLLDEDWKAGVLADWERFRSEDPEGYRAELAEQTAWDVTLADGLEDEPPYESDDPEWVAAGGAPLTKPEDVA